MADNKEKGKEKEGEEIVKVFKQERERLEKKQNEQEKLSEEEDEKLQFFKVCDQQAIHLSAVDVYTKEDLIELGFNKKGTRDRLLAWIAHIGILFVFTALIRVAFCFTYTVLIFFLYYSVFVSLQPEQPEEQVCIFNFVCFYGTNTRCILLYTVLIFSA